MIAAATASVACTITGGRMFGRMWRSRIRAGGLPTARAASTQSSARAASTWPRARRTKIGVAVIPIAIIALPSEGPRNAASAIARIRNGTASIASVIRPITASTQPPT